MEPIGTNRDSRFSNRLPRRSPGGVTPVGPSPIVAIAKETHAGAYHLVTPSGAYYVDGVAASTYVAYIPHAAWKVGA